MNHLVSILVLANLSMASAARAQRQESGLRPDTRVRLIVLDTIDASTGDLRYTNQEGTIARTDDRFFILRPKSIAGVPVADTLRVPIAKISYGEAFTGMKRHTVRGAVVGGVVGAIVGYASGNGGGDATRRCIDTGGAVFCGTSPGHPDKRPANAAAFAGIGAVAGGIVGHFIRTEGWSKIDLAPLRP